MSNRPTPEKGRPKKPTSAYRVMVAVALRIMTKRAEASGRSREVVSR